MKTKCLLIALGIGFLASAAVAAEKVKDGKATPQKQPKAVPEAPHVEKNVALTGSYVKRDVRRNGVITDGTTPVFVLDSDAIRNSGAADLSQLLLRRGFRR